MAAGRRRGRVDEHGQQHRVEDADICGDLLDPIANDGDSELSGNVAQQHGGDALDKLQALVNKGHSFSGANEANLQRPSRHWHPPSLL